MLLTKARKLLIKVATVAITGGNVISFFEYIQRVSGVLILLAWRIGYSIVEHTGQNKVVISSTKDEHQGTD